MRSSDEYLVCYLVYKYLVIYTTPLPHLLPVTGFFFNLKIIKEVKNDVTNTVGAKL